MNAVVTPNPLEWLLMLLLGGGFGGGSGLPPGEEDHAVANVAPAECLFYTSWVGSGAPEATNENPTLALLAEPAVQQFLKEHGPRMLSSLQVFVGFDPAALRNRRRSKRQKCEFC